MADDPVLPELAVVTLARDVATPHGVLPVGSLGTIVHVYPDGVAYLVEFDAPSHVVELERNDLTVRGK